MIIQIENLRLRTIIGIYDWEKENKQDVTINIIIAQRLIRKLCDNCKKTITKERWPAALSLGLTEEELESGKIFEAGKGCKKCNSGYKGRTNICEALYFTPAWMPPE